MNIVLKLIKDFIQKTTLTGAEEIPVNDNNSDRKITVQSIADFVGTSSVNSVNTQTGDVVLDSDDISEGSTNKYVTETEKNLIATIEDKISVQDGYSKNETTPDINLGSPTTLILDYADKNICIAQKVGGGAIAIATDFTLQEQNTTQRKESYLFIQVPASYTISITLSGNLIVNDTRITGNVLTLDSGIYLIHQVYDSLNTYLNITPSAGNGGGTYPFDKTLDPTGFTNNENINVSYDSTTRTVTLNGTFEAYYQGSKVSALVDGWQSEAHPDVYGTYFLRYNGTNFVFDTSPWGFTDIMICLVQYQANYKVAVREVHGFMPWQSHEELHDQIGTYIKSGGDMSQYVLNSTTAADRRPDINLTVVKDEDIKTNNASLTTKLYTQRYLSGSGDKEYTTDQSDIIALSGNQPYYNEWNGSAWVQTLFPNNNYGKLFLVGSPTTADSESQKYRYLWVQPQQVSGDLSEIQSLTPSSLTHGVSASLLSEYVFFGEIIIQYASGNWKLIEVNKITGSQRSQTSSSGNFLTTVSVDGTTITGNGADVPLSAQTYSEEVAASIEKTGLNDTDKIGITDSLDSFNTKSVLWSTFKSVLKTYFDSIYSTVTTYLGLSDTPSTYTGHAGKVATVKQTEDGIEFTTVSGGGGGTIQDNGVDQPTEDKINFIGTTVTNDAANNRNNVEVSIAAASDTDLTGISDSDVLSFNSATSKIEKTSITPFNLIETSIFANITADGQIIGAVIPAGYKIDTIILENTGTAAAIFYLSSNGVQNDITDTNYSVAAGGFWDVPLSQDINSGYRRFFSLTDDSNLYAYTSTGVWTNVVLNIYLTLKKVI